jgi:hypothetical protein
VVPAAEYAARWQPDFEKVEAEHDDLAAELREVYPQSVDKITDLLTSINACDAETTSRHRVACLRWNS